MHAVSAISLSGMGAAQAALGAAAHNIANQATPEFRRSQVLQNTASQPGGVDTVRRQADTPGHAIERDMLDQLQAKNDFLANLAVFRTSDALLGTLLDATG